jgi:hypothetical protein
MRKQFAWIVVAALAGCGQLGSAKKPAAPAGSFAGVNGWGPLTWDMNVDQAQAALAQAGIAFRREDRSYYALAEAQAIEPRPQPEERQRPPDEDRIYQGDGGIDPPNPPHQPPPPPVIAPLLMLQFAGGWTGQAVFGANQLMQEITLTSPELGTQAEANGALADHQQRFGPTRNQPVANGTSIEYDWQSATTTLTMWIWQDPNTTRWHVVERYAPIR